MKISFRRVHYGSSHYRKVRQLYRQAFPKIEQLPLWLLSLMALRPGIEFYAIYDGNDFCGLLYLVSYRGKTMIFYFAIRDDLRSKGYGREVLKWLNNRISSVSLIMESMHEECDNMEQRRNRRDFYLRNGFLDTGFYTKSEAGTFDILSTEPEINPAVLQKQIRKLIFWSPDIEVGKFSQP